MKAAGAKRRTFGAVDPTPITGETSAPVCIYSEVDLSATPWVKTCDCPAKFKAYKASSCPHKHREMRHNPYPNAHREKLRIRACSHPAAKTHEDEAGPTGSESTPLSDVPLEWRNAR